MTGLPHNHADFDLPVDRIKHTSTPHFWKGAEPGETEAAFSARLAADLEALVLAEGPDTVAAFIAEPVMGAGGVIVPPAGYFPAIAEVCRKYDMLMISDEVICGFGRTGDWFGAQALDFPATSMSMAKQLTGGYMPLSAVAINRDMAEAIEANSGKIGTFGHGFTYGGHPVGCAVGVKALEIYERIDIVGRVRGIAPRFRAHLDRLGGHPLVGEARGLGLLGAVELAPNGSPKGFAAPGKVGAKAVHELLARGIITRAIVDSLVFCPPMIITEAEIDEMFAAVGPALDATLDWAKAEGHFA
jgi:4-aminobutyrate--pyruvate transaminase